jgi:hypothetical protein
MSNFKFEKGQKFGAYIDSQRSSCLQFFEILDPEYSDGGLECALVKWTEADGSSTTPISDNTSTIRYYDINNGNENSFTMHGVITCIQVKNEYEELALKLKYASRT